VHNRDLIPVSALIGLKLAIIPSSYANSKGHQPLEIGHADGVVGGGVYKENAFVGSAEMKMGSILRGNTVVFGAKATMEGMGW